MSKKNGLSLGETVLFGMLGAMMFALQVVMAPLPNIEPVSLMVMIYGAVFGWRALYPVYVFVVMEVLFHGLGLWNIISPHSLWRYRVGIWFKNPENMEPSEFALKCDIVSGVILLFIGVILIFLALAM